MRTTVGMPAVRGSVIVFSILDAFYALHYLSEARRYDSPLERRGRDAHRLLLLLHRQGHLF